MRMAVGIGPPGGVWAAKKSLTLAQFMVSRFCSALVAADVSPEGASVRPAKGEALVQRPHQNPFLFPVTSGPTGQEFIFNPMPAPLRRRRWAVVLRHRQPQVSHTPEKGAVGAFPARLRWGEDQSGPVHILDQVQEAVTLETQGPVEYRRIAGAWRTR